MYTMVFYDDSLLVLKSNMDKDLHKVPPIHYITLHHIHHNITKGTLKGTLESTRSL